MNEQMELMRRAIEQHMEAQVREVVAQEADKASKAVASRIREMGQQVAAKAMTWHRMEMRGNELVITINIPQHDGPVTKG